MDRGRHRVEAVVLNRTPYGEADLIVSFFTREHGKVRGLAKHGRKSRKRFGNVLSSPALVELAFTHSTNRDLVRLEEGDLLRSFDGLAQDVHRLALAGQMLELVDAFCALHDPTPTAMDLLLWGLNRLDQGIRPSETQFVFRLRMLGLAGFGPNMEACPVCGRTPDLAGPVDLKPDQGGLVCRACRPGGFPVSPGSLKLMRMVQSLETAKLDRIRVSPATEAEVDPFLMAFIRHTLGRELKTAKFLDQMAKTADGE